MENNFFWVSKNRNLHEKDYIFGGKKEFLDLVNRCFEVVDLNNESAEIKMENGKAVIYYASELDRSNEELEGHILIEVNADLPLTSYRINKIFGEFVTSNNAFLFQVTDEEEKLVIG